MPNPIVKKVKIGSVYYDINDLRFGSTYISADDVQHMLTLSNDVVKISADTTGGLILTNVADPTNEFDAVNKKYVDAEIAKVPHFKVQVYDVLPTASAATLSIIALVEDTASVSGNVYKEYITVQSGSGSSATYAWEQIGTTETDLTQYVKKTTKIADVAINDGITKTQLETALDLKDLAHKDTATGSTTLSTADSVTINEVTVAGDATVTYASADAVIDTNTKADYTPAGNVTLNELTQTETEITSTGKFTPAGTIAANTTDGSFAALKTATFEKTATGGVQIEGTNAASNVTITPSTGAFVKSLKAGTADAATLTKGTASSVAVASYTAAEECLTFTTASVVAFDELSLSSEKIPVVDQTDNAWTGYTEATAAAQTFTGASYKNTVTTDTALKNVVFTGTEGDVSATGKYDKATANGATFEGTTASKLIPTKVTYDKAADTAAFSVKVTPTGTLNNSDKTIEVTVS